MCTPPLVVGQGLQVHYLTPCLSQAEARKNLTFLRRGLSPPQRQWFQMLRMHSDPTNVVHLPFMYNRESHVSFCWIRKVACTTWSRAFNVIAGKPEVR